MSKKAVKPTPKSSDTKSLIHELAMEASHSGNKSNKQISNEMNKILDELDENDLSEADNDIEIEDDEENDQDENQDKNLNEENLTNDFKEKVIMYIKCDDLIRSKMEEIKELKEKKKPCEEYIIKYLDRKDSPYVKVKDGKLIKNKSETKGALKTDIIKDAIQEGIKDEKLNEINAVKTADITAKIMDLMENKRIKNVRVNLKRTFVRKENEKKNLKKE